jgi:hypothetical protein
VPINLPYCVLNVHLLCVGIVEPVWLSAWSLCGCLCGACVAVCVEPAWLSVCSLCGCLRVACVAVCVVGDLCDAL